jgi:hypothetical protein
VAKKKHPHLLLKPLLLHLPHLLLTLPHLLLHLLLPLLKRRSNFFCFQKNATFGWLFFVCHKGEAVNRSSVGQ